MVKAYLKKQKKMEKILFGQEEQKFPILTTFLAPAPAQIPMTFLPPQHPMGYLQPQMMPMMMPIMPMPEPIKKPQIQYWYSLCYLWHVLKNQNGHLPPCNCPQNLVGK